VSWAAAPEPGVPANLAPPRPPNPRRQVVQGQGQLRSPSSAEHRRNLIQAMPRFAKGHRAGAHVSRLLELPPERQEVVYVPSGVGKAELRLTELLQKVRVLGSDGGSD